MAGFDVSKVIAAYQAGQQIKQHKLQQARDVEDRDFELKHRQAQLKLDNIQHQLMKRKLEQENSAAMEGQPGEEVKIPGFNATETPGMQQGEASPVDMADGGDGLQAIIAQLQNRTAPTFQALTPGVQNPDVMKDLPLEAQQISGVDMSGIGLGQVPGYTDQPKSMQEILRAQSEKRKQGIQDELLKPQKLGPGDILSVGGNTVASNPKEATAPAEKNQQFRDVVKGTDNVRQYFDGSDPSKVTFEVVLDKVKDKSDDPLTSFQRNQTFMNISNKYQADSIVNQSIKGQTAKALADQVIKDPQKATNQLASLYLYVKNLDPDSAVREGEIGLARQTQSYFQTFGTSLARVNAGQVISPAAAVELAKATKELVAAWENTAKTRTAQYKAQAETAGVGSQFGQYLAGFQGVTPTTGAAGKKNLGEMSTDELLKELAK